MKIQTALGLILLLTASLHSKAENAYSGEHRNSIHGSAEPARPISPFNPKGHVVTGSARAMTVYEIKSLKIAKDDTTIKTISGVTFAESVAILELTLEVEGNLCGADPKSIAVHGALPVSSEGNVTTTELSLFYTVQRPDPYSLVLSGCNLISKVTTIKLPLQISGSAHNKGKKEQLRFQLAGKTVQATFDHEGKWHLQIM